MAVSNEFLEFITGQLEGWGDVTTRKMFGGAGLYRDGKMFALVSNDVAYLKVDESNKDKFVSAGSSPFQPYADKPVTMSYYEIPPDILENPGELIIWAEESLAIQKNKK